MVKFGEAPYLECSSKGDKRFSAFYATLDVYAGSTIESIYQANKMFPGNVTGLSWRSAKGRDDCVNMLGARKLYRKLWRQYIKENPALLPVLRSASGLSDVFGQAGHACQAEELWLIRNDRRFK
jgi:hypothetical protein